MTPQNKTPTTGQSVAGATKFQQPKQSLPTSPLKRKARFSLRAMLLNHEFGLYGIVAALCFLGAFK